MKHFISIRSKMQVEANVSYRFTQDIKDSEDTEIETHLYIPRSLGINQKTYPKYLFYRNLQSISEFELRPMTLRELSSPEGEAIGLLEAARDRLLKNPSQSTDASVVHRVYCRAVVNALDAQCTLLVGEPDSARQRDQLAYYLDNCEALTRNLRALIPLDASQEEAYRPIFQVCDEFLSLTLEQSCYRLLDLLGKHKIDSTFVTVLLGFARSEAGYRETLGYPSLSSSRRRSEDLVNRRDTLAQHVNSALYLTTEGRREGVFIREMFLSIAAGLAMIFATGVTFMAHAHYENWTSTFFIVLVISYMFKDRIKAQSQVLLTRHSRRFFFDYKTQIYGAAGGKPLGYKREAFEFIDPDKIDPEIQRRRNRYLPSYGAQQQSEEKVIRYKRRLGFYTRHFDQEYAGFPLDGLSNHVRYDFHRFFRKMDDAKTEIYLPDGDGFQKVAGRRVTHLHMLIKVSRPDSTSYKHLRLVLNRNGLKRVDELSDI